MSIFTPIVALISKLWDCGATCTIYICELEKNHTSLSSELRILKGERDEVKRRVREAEERQMKPREPVETWLKMVEEIELEVEAVIKEGSQQISTMCLGGCCPMNCWSSHKTGKTLVEKLTAVTRLVTQAENFLEVADPLTIARVNEMPIRPTKGMDLMVENVWKCLTEEDEVGIIGVYGLRGVGKTTLLKKINNKFLHRGTRDFDVVIWVTVSQESNLMNVQKSIGDRLGLRLPEDEATRAVTIFNVLSKKRFVVLLDDIWDRLVDFEHIGIPHPNNINKSKVVFTTRSQVVSLRMEAQKIFKAECLGPTEAWDLFQMIVGNEALNSHHEIPGLAAKVALECQGLPLELITIGRIMASKKALHEWNDAVKLLRISTSEEKEPISVGLWGGSGGTPWCYRARGGITHITITYGAGIDSIIFKTHATGEMKIGGGGPRIDEIDFDWPHEYLTSISGSYGTIYTNGQGPIVVTSLKLITNKSEYGPFGMEVGTRFTVPPTNGGVIVGFHGRSAQYIDAIGVYLTT